MPAAVGVAVHCMFGFLGEVTLGGVRDISCMPYTTPVLVVCLPSLLLVAGEVWCAASYGSLSTPPTTTLLGFVCLCVCARTERVRCEV
jgi:hypothetical protein